MKKYEGYRKGERMKKQTYDLIVFGGVCCDIVMSGINRLPKPGEEIWAESMKITVGGTFNVAAAAARLNLKTGLPCLIGNDMLSKFILTTAEQEAIDTSLFLQTQEDYEQLSVVLNFGTDRAFVSYSADSRQKDLEHHILEIAENNPSKTVVFGMSTNPLYHQAMRKMKEQGSKIVLDCSWDEEVLRSDALKEQIRCCDYFMPNLAEAQCITGHQDADEAAKILSGITKNVIIKLGADGAVYACNGVIKRYSAIDLGRVIDTTGAGDNFAAGFCYGLVRGETVDKCILYGQLCGSKSVIAVGGFTASLYESELYSLFKESWVLEEIS